MVRARVLDRSVVGVESAAAVAEEDVAASPADVRQVLVEHPPRVPPEEEVEVGQEQPPRSVYAASTGPAPGTTTTPSWPATIAAPATPRRDYSRRRGRRGRRRRTAWRVRRREVSGTYGRLYGTTYARGAGRSTYVPVTVSKSLSAYDWKFDPIRSRFMRLFPEKKTFLFDDKQGL